LTKTRHVTLPREVLVYPKIEPAEDFFEILPLVRGEWESFVRGRGASLYRIREYMPEDSARHVDWKATAKSGSLKVREFAREDERKVRIVFDNPATSAISAVAYERAVDLTASLGWHFSTQEGEASFVVAGRPRTRDLHEFLAWLAVIEPVDLRNKDAVKNSIGVNRPNDTGIPFEDVLRELALDNSDDFNVVITARPRGSLPTALWNSSYFVFVGEPAARPPQNR
jgi:uncharacterized protein (DUF58 family)